MSNHRTELQAQNEVSRIILLCQQSYRRGPQNAHEFGPVLLGPGLGECEFGDIFRGT